MKFLTSLFLTLGLIASGAAAKEYILDTAHSSVGFTVKHMMISSVKGTFGSYDADIAFDPSTKKFTTLNARIKADSINTANQKRDEHLRSADFFEVEKYPSIDFAMSSYDATTGKMKGNLSIRGTTRPVELQTTINGIIKDMQGNERVGFTLEGLVDRKEFGLTWNKALEAGGIVVGDEVKMTIEVQMIQL
jgi:polyisoprenoid-binding protein YceI